METYMEVEAGRWESRVEMRSRESEWKSPVEW